MAAYHSALSAEGAAVALVDDGGSRGGLAAPGGGGLRGLRGGGCPGGAAARSLGGLPRPHHALCLLLAHHTPHNVRGHLLELRDKLWRGVVAVLYLTQFLLPPTRELGAFEQVDVYCRYQFAPRLGGADALALPHDVVPAK